MEIYTNKANQIVRDLKLNGFGLQDIIKIASEINNVLEKEYNPEAIENAQMQLRKEVR